MLFRSWTIASLAPGAEEVFTTSYVVKEEDVLAGKVVNVATATRKNLKKKTRNRLRTA